MSKAVVNYPESYKTTFQISRQLDTLIHQMGIENMRDTIDPEITDAEIDELLGKIEIESGRKKYLMEIVRSIVHENKISDPRQIMNIKIQVLLDNLAKKLCRCTEKDRYTEGYNPGDKIRSKEGLCRASVFHGRDIDYITHDCGEPPEDRLRYKYGMGPLLRPAMSSDSKVILRRHNKKDKSGDKSVEEPLLSKTVARAAAAVEKSPVARAAVVESSVLKSVPKMVESSNSRSCTIKSDTGRCVLGEPNMPDNCVYNADTKRCRKL